MTSKKKWLSTEEALLKMQQYCVYQDRCHQEVRSKFLDLGVYGDRLEEIIARLIAENFLNEERFARSFARGKFRIKQWGRLRIVQELKKKDVPEYCRRKALEEISEEDYVAVLKEILKKKAGDFGPATDFTTRQKITRYALSRGFEFEIIVRAMNEIFKTD